MTASVALIYPLVEPGAGIALGGFSMLLLCYNKLKKLARRTVTMIKLLRDYYMQVTHLRAMYMISFNKQNAPEVSASVTLTFTWRVNPLPEVTPRIGGASV